MRTLNLLSVILLTTLVSLAQPANQDISGLYSFVRSGETLQINLQPDGRITGYVSRVADSDSDRGQMLDMFFDKASLAGDHFEFRTRKVHGVWFEFKGKIQRGKAQTREEEGYFVLRGTLTTAREDVNGKPTPFASEVEFKSFPAGM